VKHAPVLMILVVALQACAGVGCVRPDMSCAANATYFGILDSPVTLVNGRWTGKPFVRGGACRPEVGLLSDFFVAGDMDGDGCDELAVVLWESSGGSGTFYYLSVLDMDRGGCVDVATTFIGDRIRIRGGRIRSGMLEISIYVPVPGSPAYRTSDSSVMAWCLRDGRLVRVN